MNSIEVQRTGADDYGQWLTAIIAGPTGKGKTPCAITAPSPYLIDSEAGTMSIAKADVPRTSVHSLDQLLTIKNILAAGPEVYREKLGVDEIKTVIIDTFDEVARITLSQRMSDMRRDEMKPADWQWLNDQLNAIVRGFRSLDMHVIFVCHIKDQTDGDTGALFYKLDLPGAIAHQLPAMVQLCALLDDEVVQVEDEEGVYRERRSFLYTRPLDKYDWIKDRSGTLPPVIELNFEDDWQRVIDTVFASVGELESKEIRSVTFEEREDDDVPAPTERPAGEYRTPPTPEQAAARIEEAEKKVAEARAAKEEKKPGEIVERSTTTDGADRAAEQEAVSEDLSDAAHGDKIVLEGDVPHGFQLTPKGTVLQVKGARWVYQNGNQKILSLNELPGGVVPMPDPEINSGIFCQVTGKEISANQSTLSRIRTRKILCDGEFDKAIANVKRK